MRALAAAFALVAGAAAAFAQQPASARDTVVVLRRDTVVVIQRDTVFFERPSAPEPPGGRAPVPARPTAGAPGQRPPDADTVPAYGDEEERLYRERLARLMELRAARARLLASRPDVRTSERALAYYVYPSRLLEIDFPSLMVGANIVSNGRTGVAGLLGALTTPIVNDAGFSDAGQARAGIRGFEIGLEGRYYVSPLTNRFPFYAGGHFLYAYAPLEFTRFARVPNGTFERFGTVPATASRYTLGLFTGWEFRSDNGVAIDFSTGFHFGARQLRSTNPAFNRDIGTTFRNQRSNSPTFFLFPILRIGLGFGTW